MNPESDFTAHALNMKLALRSLKKRCEEAEGQLGHDATVWDTGIVSTTPLSAGLIATTEHVIDLFNNVAYLVNMGQFGIRYSEDPQGTSYIPIPANKLVTALTQGITDQDEAFAVLERFYRAIMNLP